LDQLGGDLPVITVALIAISDFLRYQWYFLFGIIARLVVGFILYYRTDTGRHVIDRIALKMPGSGRLCQERATDTFSNTFGLLVKRGVTIIESIEFTKGTAGNGIVEGVLEETKEAGRRGERISNTLTRYPIVFPPLVSSMIAIGE